MMIDLTGKSVFVKTQEEYLSILKIARFQGFIWARENHLNPIVIPFPNILNFYGSKIVTYSYVEKTLYEASEIVEDEEKIKDAVKLVRTFAKYPDRTALTDSFIESLKLLADTVESQMERLTQRENDKLIMVKQDNGEYIPAYWDEDNFKAIKKLADYEDLEARSLLVRLPCKVGDMVWDNVFGYPESYEIKAFSYGYCDSYVEPDIEDQIIFYYEKYSGLITGAFPMSEIGKTVFLTREEAEKKLEEMRANGK